VLRSAALADERVIAMINGELVPVWINIRKQPVPPFAFTGQFLLNGRLDGERMIKDPFSEGFFVRSLVVTPDGETLLNPQPPTVVGASMQFFSRGDVSYAQMDSGDYLSMLMHALARFHEQQASK
jgi:hypothetical protein